MKTLISIGLMVTLAFIALFASTSIILEGSYYGFNHPSTNPYDFYIHLFQTSAAPYILIICGVGFLATLVYEIQKYIRNRKRGSNI